MPPNPQVPLLGNEPADKEATPDIAAELQQAVYASENKQALVLETLRLMAAASQAGGIALLTPCETGAELFVSRGLDAERFEELVGSNQTLLEAFAASFENYQQHYSRLPNVLEVEGAGDEERPIATLETTAIYTPLSNGSETYAVAVTIYPCAEDASLDGRREIVRLIADRSEAWFDKRRAHFAENLSSELRKEHAACVRISQNVDRNRFAYDLVNELQQLLGCDRVAYLVSTGSNSCKPLAFSGQPIFDKRSNSVRRLARLVKTVLRSKQPFWSSEGGELAPQLEKPLDAYREESHVNSLAVLPLVIAPPAVNPTHKQSMEEMVNEGTPKNERVIGAIVLEQMQSELDREAIQERWNRIELPVLNAAENSRRHNSLFLMPVWRLLGMFFELYMGSTRKKAVAVTAAVVVCVMALLIVPADLTIRCEGVLTPRQLQHVFPQEEGTITQILVSDGDRVREGQLLLRQRNLDLDSKRVEAVGELARLRAERRSMEKELVSHRLGKNDEQEKEKGGQLTIDYAANRAKIRMQEEMVSLANSRVGNLDVRAAFDGVVFAWNAKRRLGERTVSQQNRLFSVARIEGPWQLDLKVPDRRAGYVVRAWRESLLEQTPLRITYVRTSDPETHFEAVVCHVQENLEVGPKEESVLPVQGDVPREVVDATKPGTPVVAKIHCGRVSIGYAKLYEFFDWVQRIWFTYVF